MHVSTSLWNILVSLWISITSWLHRSLLVHKLTRDYKVTQLLTSLCSSSSCLLSTCSWCISYCWTSTCITVFTARWLNIGYQVRVQLAIGIIICSFSYCVVRLSFLLVCIYYNSRWSSVMISVTITLWLNFSWPLLKSMVTSTYSRINSSCHIQAVNSINLFIPGD